MSIELRDYQRNAIAGLHAAWAGRERGTGTGVSSRAAVVLPTGAGKTVVFAHPSLRDPVLGERGRMLVLVHRDELAVQAVAKIRSIDPMCSVGRVQNVWDETDARVVVASVQTLANPRRRERIRDVGLIVVDEAHHATAPTYVSVLRHYGAFSAPGTPVAGFSATLARSDDAHLGDIWQEVVLRLDILHGIRHGWLVDMVGKRVELAGLDLRQVRRTAGDYGDRALGEELQAADAPEHVAQSYVELASDRQGITFWPTVDTAHAGAAAYASVGVPTAVITGSTPPDERARVYEEYRRGRLQMLSSVMVLTEGFDMPQASAAVIARPTQSAPLYVQMAGRVLRPWHLPVPGFAPKHDALLIDVVGTTGNHRLATMADLSVTAKVEPKDGQSLLAAADEMLDEAERRAAVTAGELDPVTGRRVIRDVDLFGDRVSVWLQTPAGTWFLPVGDWLVFLWPDADALGLWMIGVTGSKAPVGSAQRLAAGMTLEWAMDQAEGYAGRLQRELGAIGAGRKAPRRRDGPRPNALAYARSLGARLPEHPTKGQVSDAISTALATRALGG